MARRGKDRVAFTSHRTGVLCMCLAPPCVTLTTIQNRHETEANSKASKLFTLGANEWQM